MMERKDRAQESIWYLEGAIFTVSDRPLRAGSASKRGPIIRCLLRQFQPWKNFFFIIFPKDKIRRMGVQMQ